MDTRATPFAATLVTTAALLLLSSCATSPAPAPSEEAAAECTAPKAGLYVLVELVDGSRRESMETPVLAYWLDRGENAIQLEPLRWDTSASAWVPASGNPVYLPLQSPCVAETARIMLTARDSGIEILYKPEQLRARYGPP